MGKHRLQRESNLRPVVRGALIAGAVTAGTVALPSAPALAATINIPGLGDVNVPDLPAPPPPAGISLPQLPSLPKLPDLQLPPPPSGLPGIPAVPNFQSNVVGERALQAAESKVGAQYVWGGSGPYVFDCSGLVQWAYRQAGVQLPRTSFAQAQVGQAVSKADLEPGDIVIFDGGGHAALYAGNGQIVHASTSGQPVKYAPLNSMAFYAARRVT
ncbi:NlpC/P60 family protein [Skermania sp. ID1734]|uniref:C40 family peptidase n=1 Tax=Skermania sp. ID1734 TaxID=2597516 RepID=UPI001180ABE4|nr:NlpC/P60 family protein [Skermania sp. ID1734]TSE00379.1 NlpC/P60 family protein [Skermania sp. ID1734]